MICIDRLTVKRSDIRDDDRIAFPVDDNLHDCPSEDHLRLNAENDDCGLAWGGGENLIFATTRSDQEE